MREFAQRTVLMTGGTGFICMSVAEVLLDHGVDVVIFARREPEEQAVREFSLKKGRFYYYCGDVLDNESIISAMNRYSVGSIIHGAAITPSREDEMARPKQVIEINCIGLMNALDAARIACSGRFIYLGSISGYGQTCFNSKVLLEGKSLGDPQSLYDLSKFTGERILQRYRDLFQMDAIVARIGDTFGPWERKTGVRSHMSLPHQLVSAARKGEKAILPRPNSIDRVYSRDIAASIYALLCAQTLRYDIYPLCSGYIWPLMDWCKLLENYFPDFHWDLAQPGEEPTIRVNQSEDNAPMQIDRLLEDTGYRPIYDAVRAFENYMTWIETHTDYV